MLPGHAVGTKRTKMLTPARSSKIECYRGGKVKDLVIRQSEASALPRCVIRGVQAHSVRR